MTEPRGEQGWALGLGKAKLRIEGQSLQRHQPPTKNHSPLEPGRALIPNFLEEIRRTCQNRGSHPLSSTEDTCRNTLPKQAGRPCEGICCLFSLLYLQRFPAFPAAAMPWLRRFRHCCAWTAPTCNPSFHPLATPLSTRLRGPSSSGARSACGSPIQHPISTITVMISTITSAVTTVNTTVSCHLDKAGEVRRIEEKSPSFQAWKARVRSRLQPENKRDACLRERKVKTGERASGREDRWGTCQTPAFVASCPFSRLKGLFSSGN